MNLYACFTTLVEREPSSADVHCQSVDQITGTLCLQTSDLICLRTTVMHSRSVFTHTTLCWLWACVCMSVTHQWNWMTGFFWDTYPFSLLDYFQHVVMLGVTSCFTTVACFIQISLCVLLINCMCTVSVGLVNHWVWLSSFRSEAINFND